MKKEVKTPLLVVIAVVAVAVLIYFGAKLIGSTGDLDQGQVKYTPGRPPWEETDPSKKGPGGPPGGGGPGAPQGAGAQQLPPGTPQGIPAGPPTLGNGK